MSAPQGKRRRSWAPGKYKETRKSKFIMHLLQRAFGTCTHMVPTCSLVTVSLTFLVDARVDVNSADSTHSGSMQMRRRWFLYKKYDKYLVEGKYIQPVIRLFQCHKSKCVWEVRWGEGGRERRREGERKRELERCS